jgi:hypothetical protein
MFGYITQVAATVEAGLHPSPETILAAGGSIPVGDFTKRVAERAGAEWRPVVFGNWMKRQAKT